jgi:hypothetical protein
MLRSVCSVLAGVTLLSAVSALRADDQAQGLAIVTKAIKAAGGEENLAKFKAHTWTEKGTYYGMGNALPYTGKYAVQMPDKFRMEIEGFFTLVLDGDKGWTSMGGATDEMSKEQMAEQKETLYCGYVSTLLPLKDKAFHLAPVGEGKVDNRPAVIVKVTQKDRRDVMLFFDKENNLLIKTEYKAKAQEQGGQEVNQEVFLSKYKDVDGAKMPMTVVIKRDGKPYVEAENSDLKPADKLDAKLFAKP